MEQNFYKMAFSCLKGLYDLKLITEYEKTQLKDILFREDSHPYVQLTVEQITISILYRVQQMRKYTNKSSKLTKQLTPIDEETDEEPKY